MSEASHRRALRSWRPAHYVLFLGFRLEHKRADRVDDHLDKGDMDRPEQDGQAERQRHQSQTGNRHLHGKDKSSRLAQIVVDAAAEPNCLDDRTEVVVQENDGGSLALNVGSSSAHRNADMRGLERWRVVDADAGHRHDFPFRLA